MTDADDTHRELADINRRLAELPDDAFNARIDLRERRDELRAEALRRGRADTPTAELEADLRRLRRRYDELVARRLSAGHVGGAGGDGGGGFEPVVLANLNAAIDRGSGIDDVEEAIRVLERELDVRRAAEA